MTQKHMRICAVFALLTFFAIERASSQTADDPVTFSDEPASDAGVSAKTGPSSYLYPVQNLDQELPGWLRFGGEYRSRPEGQYGLKYGSSQDLYLLSRLRVNTTITPTRWLTFFGEMQDARVLFNQAIPNTPSNQDTWELRQAYVQLGSSKDGWMDLRVGRQVLQFGNGRLIGPSDWTNTTRTFDAARLDIHHAGSEVALFASSVVVERDGVIDHHNEANNLYGAYGTLHRLLPRATVEPYVFWRLAHSGSGLTSFSIPGAVNEVTAGARVVGTLPGSLDYEVEMNRQTGSIGTRSIGAWSGLWIFGKTFQSIATTPRIFIESNYASGNKNPAGNTWGTFDQLYPSAHDKLGFADQIGRRNIQQIRTGVEETLARKWRLSQHFESFWLATTHDALYANAGGVAIAADPAAPSRHVGDELDLIADYRFSKGLIFGIGYARIFAGSFLEHTSPGKDFSYPFFYLTYRF